MNRFQASDCLVISGCRTFGLPEDETHLVDEVLAVIVGQVLSSDDSVAECQLVACSPQRRSAHRSVSINS